jgi:hypothetical protein
MTRTQRGAWTAMAAALVLASGTQARAISDADKCEAAKNKIAGKYAFCREKAEAKAIKTGGSPDYTKCDAKFSQKWMDAETNGGGMCPTSGDQAAMQSCVTGATNLWTAALSGSGTCAPVSGLPETGQTQCDQGAGTLGACPGSPAGQDGAVLAGTARSYTDNGDGTITDNATGLMWEKLSDDGSIHDWNDVYTWYDAFNVKIAALNGGGGFAGHTDWRLPNRLELDTLADLGRVSPAIDPAFNTSCTPSCTVTTCSCTQSTYYWSSTTYQDGPPNAWGVLLLRRLRGRVQ